MKIFSFHEPQSGTWTHLLADPDSGQAAIIDPVWVYDIVSGVAELSFAESVVKKAGEMGFSVSWILETHAHADHLTAADQLRQMTGAKLACGRGICSVQANFAKVFNLDIPTDGSQFDLLLAEGDELQLGSLTIRVLETPGHTNDSIVYRVGDAAFIGDTLFAPAYGSARCDFPGGDASQLYDSIQKIYALPEDTRLFLCHDYPSEGKEAVPMVPLARMKQENIHCRENTPRAEFVAMRTQRDSQLNLPKLILPSLQVNIRAGDLPEADSNGAVYLRSPFNRSIAELISG